MKKLMDMSFECFNIELKNQEFKDSLLNIFDDNKTAVFRVIILSLLDIEHDGSISIIDKIRDGFDLMSIGKKWGKQAKDKGQIDNAITELYVDQLEQYMIRKNISVQKEAAVQLAKDAYRTGNWEKVGDVIDYLNDPKKNNIKKTNKIDTIGRKLSTYTIRNGEVIKLSGSNTIDRINKLIDKGYYQIILTGAPGTGKTYDALQCAEFNGTKLGTDPKDKNYEFVQFHSSYDYTDFVEGLRPVDDGTGGMKFVKVDGIFKQFCRKVVEINGGTNSESDTIDGNKKLFFFIIDEINRADLNKVFGELMFGLEQNYRGEKHKFKTQYQNLPTYYLDEYDWKMMKVEEDVYSDGFYIPDNVVIIGTMNDIDRSVEAFDFALRRRFQWVEIKAADVMEGKLKMMRTEQVDELVQRISKVNGLISDKEKGGRLMLNEAFHIGPAYLKTGNYREIWEYRIEPILKEYCRSFKADNFIEECEKAFLAEEYLAQSSAQIT